MKIASKKRSFWVYFGLIFMLVALVLFSVLPLVSAIIKEQNQGHNNNSVVVNSRLDQEALGYQLVLEREPENQNALRGLLNIRLQQGDIKGAIEPLARLSQLNPDLLDYQLLLAQTQAQVEDYEGAEATYQKALNQRPANPVILKNWTDMLLRQNRPQEAVSLIKRVMSQITDGDRTALQLLLGEVYTSQGETEEAIAVYNQAITSNKDDFRPVLAKALLLQPENPSDADPLFKKAIELAPVQYKDQIKKLAVSSS